MAKSNNLFTADDFSKDGGKKFPWWIIIAIVVVAIIVALLFFLKKDKTTEPTPSAPVEQVADIPSPAPEANEALTVPADEPSTTQEAPKADEPKVGVQKQTTNTTTTTTQYSGDLSILNGKTLKEKANVVISGYFGNNPERKRILGDAYKEIQDKVNQMYRDGEVR